MEKLVVNLATIKTYEKLLEIKLSDHMYKDKVLRRTQ